MVLGIGLPLNRESTTSWPQSVQHVAEPVHHSGKGRKPSRVGAGNSIFGVDRRRLFSISQIGGHEIRLAFFASPQLVY
jgi:hypothetical protein